MEELLDTPPGDTITPFERWLQALTTLELAEAHFGPHRSGVVDMFQAQELAARLALQPARMLPWH